MSQRAEQSEVDDFVCPRCGCLCDDLRLTIEAHRAVAAEGACAIAQAWFARMADELAAACLVDGQPADLDSGLQQAAELLVAARAPLVYGLSRATSQAQRQAVALAERIGGVIDTPASLLGGAVGVTFSDGGLPTCTLGEIRHRSDLVVVWGCDLAASHPRLLSRHLLDPAGAFVAGGRAGRTCVLVGDVDRDILPDADWRIALPAEHDVAALWVLRALVRGVDLADNDVRAATGVGLDVWSRLAEQLRRARYAALLLAPRGGANRYVTIDAMACLARDLHAQTRAVVRIVDGIGNAAGAENVLLWRTGFPFAVSLAGGVPRFDPRDYSAQRLLERGEVDAVLIVADDPAQWLSPAALQRLARLPKVVVNSEPITAEATAAVVLRTAEPGLFASGTMYRLDNVPLSLRPVLGSQYASDAQLLSRLVHAVDRALGRPDNEGASGSAG